MPHTIKPVLVFTSQPIISDITAYRLKLLNLDPLVVSDEEELNNELQTQLPSLLVLDLDLTQCDAIPIIERWSSDEATSQIPVLCLSSEGDLTKAERAFLAGAREFVVLPFDPIVLENKVLSLLEKAKQQEAKAPAPAAQ